MPSTPHPSITTAEILPIRPFRPDLHERAWVSIPHPTLPLLATAHAKSVTVFSLATLSSHSSLTGGHTRSVRTAAWKPGLPPHKLCLVSGSFDATAGLWRWDGDSAAETEALLETEITAASTRRGRRGGTVDDGDDDDHDSGASHMAGDQDWEFTLVLEGHDSEVKCCSFAPSGAYLATCSRDKSIWIWEDIGASEADDEWETVAVLNEHEGDVKAVAWCPDVPGRNSRPRQYSPDVLASASYDNTVRIWREDSDGEWVCVAVLEGHEGTVWAIEWEQRPSRDGRFPRLLSSSADGTIRVWELRQDEDDQEGGGAEAQGGENGPGRISLGGIPNTMRTSLREDWTCTAILPPGHDRDVYSVSWSKQTGLIASTGRDGNVVLYQERHHNHNRNSPGPAAAESNTTGTDQSAAQPSSSPPPSTWELLTTLRNAHGPFEVNHITWCRRYDAAADKRGEEEMLVTTGDDGVVRSWHVKTES